MPGLMGYLRPLSSAFRGAALVLGDSESVDVQSMSATRSRCVIYGSLLWLTAVPAQAQAQGILDRGSVEIGVGASALGGKLAVDGSAGTTGTDINLRSDLDLAGHDRSRLFALRWQPWDRHGFALRAQRFGRSADRIIQRDIVFDDQVFEVNTRVLGSINLDLLSFTYTGWLLADEARAIGLTAGALQYRLGVELAADNLPGGAQPQPIKAEASEQLPVLVLGAEYREALNTRLQLVLRAAVFKARLNDIDGTVYDLEGGLEYAFTPQWALALRYSATHLDADTARENLAGRIRLGLSGAQATLIWRW